MSQPGFFDLDERYLKLSEQGDPLVALNAAIPWSKFRPILSKLRTRPRKSNAGRKPYDAVLMFKLLVLQSLYNLADEQVEYQVRDRLSFMRFLDLSLEDRIPDATTLWLFREGLIEQGLIEPLFKRFNRYLDNQGYVARKGQIIDATIVPVPRQRNSRKDNETIKSGEVPEDWQNQPPKLAQKDTQARWAKKHNKSYYGYKNHLSIDNRHTLIRHYRATDAAVHDSQILAELIDPGNTSANVFADSAYRSQNTECDLKTKGYRSRIHHKGKRSKPLSEHQQAINKNRAKIRARVEHVFGYQENSMGGKFIRTIGLARATAKIGLMNLGYNMQRFVYLERQNSRLALSAA